MAHIKASPTLADLQEYVAAHVQERGFNQETPLQECLLLAEEVGELAKAVRKETGMAVDSQSRFGKISHEIADIIWVTTALANMYGIDLEQAFREKEVINHERVWE